MTSIFGGGASINVNASGTLVPQSFTPTDGQTVFTLTAFTYTTNTNSLLVFLNGSKQVSGIDFTETSTSSFTLTNPVTASDSLEVIGFPLSVLYQLDASVLNLRTDLSASSGSSLVGYLPSGTGVVATTVQEQLRQTVLAIPGHGIVGDGTTEDSTAIQTLIDANKGKKIIFPKGYSYLMQGVLLSGSTYNNTDIVFEGELKLNPAPLVGSSNFIACWSGIIFQDCDNCSIEGNLNGNRTAQQNKEQTYTVCLAGVTNFRIPKLYCRELRGDGVYVSQKLITSSSTNSNGLTIGEIYGYNSADDGRNLLSIISCDNVAIGVIQSIGIGGTVGGGVMPGGFDIEPDQTYQSCKNITVGTINVVTAGTSGLGIGGRAGTTVTQNIVIGSATVVNTCAATVLDGLSNLTQTINHTLVIGSCDDVTIGNYQGKFTNAYGDAVIVTNSNRVNIKGTVSHVREGARIGNDVADATGLGVVDSVIDLTVTSTSHYGIRTGKISGTRIKGLCKTPLTGFYAGSLFAVYSRDYTQTNCIYSVDVPYDANWTRAYRNDAGAPSTFVNTRIANCDVSPGTSWAGYIIIKDMAVPISNVIGYNDGPFGIPTGGPHIAGTYVKNGAPAVGSAKGWYCTVSGTPGTWVSEGNL